MHQEGSKMRRRSRSAQEEEEEANGPDNPSSSRKKPRIQSEESEEEDIAEENGEEEENSSSPSSNEEEEEVASPNEELKRTEAEIGIIERIRLENFMCHKHLELNFGPNINFVVGANGSKCCTAFGQQTLIV